MDKRTKASLVVAILSLVIIGPGAFGFAILQVYGWEWLQWQILTGKITMWHLFLGLFASCVLLAAIVALLPASKDEPDTKRNSLNN